VFEKLYLLLLWDILEFEFRVGDIHSLQISCYSRIGSPLILVLKWIISQCLIFPVEQGSPWRFSCLVYFSRVRMFVNCCSPLNLWFMCVHPWWSCDLGLFLFSEWICIIFWEFHKCTLEQSFVANQVSRWAASNVLSLIQICLFCKCSLGFIFVALFSFEYTPLNEPVFIVLTFDSIALLS